MITIVVFDMDGVLCRYRIERRLARLASWSGQRPEAIHAAIWRSGFEDEAERGVMSADDYLRGFGERMGYPLSAAQWVKARRVAIEPDLAVLSLARQLSLDRPVAMFTNNPWLLKRHMARCFLPSPTSAAHVRSSRPSLAGASRTRKPSAAWRPISSVRLTRSSISTTMPPMWRAPGRPGCRPIASAEQPACAPASPCMASSAGDRVVDL